MRKHDRELIVNTCRWLRRHATPAEKRFWELVRNRRVLGKKFYRQYPIRFYDEEIPQFFVVDFYCHECRLVVEIDGGIHIRQREYDRFRTSVIEEQGLQVIRFSNDLVLGDPDQVITQLEKVLVSADRSG